MNHFTVLLLINFITSSFLLSTSSGADEVMGERDKLVQAWLQTTEPMYSKICYISNLAAWAYETNVTDPNESRSTRISLKQSDYAKKLQKQIQEKFPWWNELKCPRLKSQIKRYFLGGPGNMTNDRVEKQLNLGNEMTSAYAKATLCNYKDPKKCDLHLDPDLVDFMKLSTDYDELEYYWTGWHDAMSKAVPPQKYAEFVELDNEGARGNGFNNYGESSANAFDDGVEGWSFENFQETMKETMASIKPNYMKLHAYVRMKLKKHYGAKVDLPGGYLPAHVLGNMWSQEWDNIESLTKPFANAPSMDATDALKKKGYTVKGMVEEADRFYQGMGLIPMNEKFWKYSIFAKPSDGRDMVCHASAYDFCIRTPRGENGDYRIKMCAEIDGYNFGTIHHEMGHIEYQMHYAHQPSQFRDGANPGFHEAIGDALALAVTTPKHLQCALGLDMKANIDCNATTTGAQPVTETDLNMLFSRALTKIAVLPFAYSMESYKWEIFSGKLTVDKFNDRWWQIRKENQGIVPPKPRPSDGFDPAAKYHIVADVEYIRYFWSNILQFQFFEAMCVAAGEYDHKNPGAKPLYQCDFSGSTKAGKLLGKMMSMGSSRPWPDALEVLTGSRVLSTDSIMNYFQPIFDQMDKELKAAGVAACFGETC